MKPSARSFKIEWDLHAWVGVGASLGLFVVFYCGVFALFLSELTVWQDPVLTSTTLVGHADRERSSFGALLEAATQDAPIPNGAAVIVRKWLAAPVSSVSIYHEASHVDRSVSFDRVTGARLAEHSRLADELFAMHYLARLPGGVQLAGFLAIALAVAVISGVVIQWRKLLKELWRFRPRLRLRYSASDAHKVLGVFGIPFTLMYGWSGALLGISSLLTLPVLYAAYGGDQQRFDNTQDSARIVRTASGRAASQLPLDQLVKLAAAALNAKRAPAPPMLPERADLELYGDENAWLSVSFQRSGFEPDASVELSAVTGEILHVSPLRQPPTRLVDMTLYDLHYALFGGYLVKGLYVLFALATCVVIVTGNIVWIERRDRRRERRGNRVLEKLTIGCCLGLVLASAAYFAANRLLPAQLWRRADLEFAVFLAVWALSVVLSCVQSAGRQACSAGFCLGSALLFGAVFASDVVGQLALGKSAVELVVVNVLTLTLAASTGAMWWAFHKRRATRATDGPHADSPAEA